MIFPNSNEGLMRKIISLLSLFWLLLSTQALLQGRLRWSIPSLPVFIHTGSLLAHMVMNKLLSAA